MIEKILLENFKSHRHTEIELDDSRLHAIIGQNSSGKTSILQSIFHVKRLVDQQYDQVFSGKNEAKFLISNGQSDGNITLRGNMFAKNSDWQFSYVLNRNHRPHSPTSLGEDVHGGYTDVYLSGIEYLQLDTNVLSQAAYSPEEFPSLQYDGTNLAPVLDYIQSDKPEKFTSIVRMLREIVPYFKNLRIRRAEVKLNQTRFLEIEGRQIPFDEVRTLGGQEIAFDMVNGDRIPAHAISEGTLLVLGLLTVLIGSEKLILLIDDVEQGLHPKAQRDLISVIKQIVARNDKLQVILTTHSPYIIDELKPSQVHVLSTDKDGFTVEKRLDEHPDAERALQFLTTGEFWDAEGEDWVLENA